MIGIYENRVTTFKRMKFKISDVQTNIDKYRETANKIIQNIISGQKFDLLRN